MLRKQIFLLLFLYLNAALVSGQSVADSSLLPETDINLRIVNLNPYFSLHVDSMLSYQLAINKDEKKYYWFLKNSPVGLKINKDNGLMTFKADKSFFLSGSFFPMHPLPLPVT